MTVSEVHKLDSLADVYELRQDCRYLIVVQRDQIPERTRDGLLKGLFKEGIRGMVLSVRDIEGLRIFDLESSGT